MRLWISPGFLLFLVLAVLMAVNGLRALVSMKKSAGSNTVLTGVVSLAAAVGLVAGAFYLFWF